MKRSMRQLILLSCLLLVLVVLAGCEAKVFRVRRLARNRSEPSKVFRGRGGPKLTIQGGKRGVLQIQKCGPILAVACVELANHCHSSVLSKRSLPDRANAKRFARKMKRRRRRCRRRKNCNKTMKKYRLRSRKKPHKQVKVTCGICRTYCW
uniref:60S ribosomal protein L34 n=1 Tax=Ciona savignyi TaxID=51511 RepID=H2ZPD3_CIOSA